MRSKMKFRLTMKKFLFVLTFFAGEMKYNFVLGMIGLKQLIKKCKQTRARSRKKYVGGNNPGIYEEVLH